MAVGRVLKDTADAEAPVDEYGRSQLLSGYSVARHLAAEQASAAELRSWFREELAKSLAGESGEPGDAGLGSRLRASEDNVEIAEIACRALERLRRDDPGAEAHRRIQRLLRELADREVAALARLPGRRGAGA